MIRVSRKRILLTLIAVLSASLPAAAAASTAAQAAPTTARPPGDPGFLRVARRCERYLARRRMGGR